MVAAARSALERPTASLTSYLSAISGGQTVVMVTHNPENCVYIDRTILLRDGLVVAEEEGVSTTQKNDRLSK